MGTPGACGVGVQSTAWVAEPGRGLPGVLEVSVRATAWEAQSLGDPPGVPRGLCWVAPAATLIRPDTPGKGSTTVLGATQVAVAVHFAMVACAPVEPRLSA